MMGGVVSLLTIAFSLYLDRKGGKLFSFFFFFNKEIGHDSLMKQFVGVVGLTPR